MSGDRRSVHTDALATLGTIIDDTQKRDAIHLAVEPIEAAEDLLPGEHVGISMGKATKKVDKKLGIVDPFLTEGVKKGEMFWLVVYPRQITSLRHVWEHPGFPGIEADEAEKWLRNFCENAKVDYDALLYAILGIDVVASINEDTIHFSGQDADGEIPEEFWKYAEVLAGRKIKERPQHFSCSC